MGQLQLIAARRESSFRARSRTPILNANVAQLVEQLIRNEQVSGSSPLIGSDKTAPIDASLADFGAVFV